MFHHFTLEFDENPYDELASSIGYEPIARGRVGANLARVGNQGSVPLVRTISKYNNPINRFQPIHRKIAEKIKQGFEEMIGISGIDFNNGMIEIYDPT